MANWLATWSCRCLHCCEANHLLDDHLAARSEGMFRRLLVCRSHRQHGSQRCHKLRRRLLELPFVGTNCLHCCNPWHHAGRPRVVHCVPGYALRTLQDHHHAQGVMHLHGIVPVMCAHQVVEFTGHKVWRCRAAATSAGPAFAHEVHLPRCLLRSEEDTATWPCTLTCAMDSAGFWDSLGGKSTSDSDGPVCSKSRLVDACLECPVRTCCTCTCCTMPASHMVGMLFAGLKADRKLHLRTTRR